MENITNNPKIFVLDTNIILHDFNSIYKFQDNDIIIPVAVIEELDKFKKGNDSINYNAREFVRALDNLSTDSMFEHGVSLGKNRGRIKVEMGHPFTQEMKDSLHDDIQDHRIIATTLWLKDRYKDRRVILVTKDVNMRLKAKALGLMAADYLNDKIKEVRVQHSKKEVINLHNTSLDKIPLKKRPAFNQLFKISNKEGAEVLLGRYDKDSKSVEEIHKTTAYGIVPRNHEQTLALDAVLNPKISLVSLTGTAGTGKTLLALAGALEQADNFNQIMLSRPVIPLKNQDIGFLPGSANEKIGPYMLPLYDNLGVIKHAFNSTSKEVVKLEDMQRREKLIISPLAYIRGRSLNNVFIIIDESQNLTPHEVKTIITRAGENTKIVFTGDIFQIDQPYLDIHSNGLTHLGEKMYGQSIFEYVDLIKGERSELSEIASKLL